MLPRGSGDFVKCLWGLGLGFCNISVGYVVFLKCTSAQDPRSSRNMSTKKEGASEVSSNEIWREVIRREQRSSSSAKDRDYACNLKALRKDQITDPPGVRAERRRELTPEEDAIATKILADYGFKKGSAPSQEESHTVSIPMTSNGVYGGLGAFAIIDERRQLNAKKGCNETKYAQSYFSMTGVSAYSKKK
uniref:Uncharacterized protein n=1 Tax=Mucochytrium quahogii TaxID=96639 RepID=A0A7S2WP78_9STRA|mmetsp:Transcript_6070/g.13578  ORF Transcript_6070/g.13578 Transcript_6070/m.13578 type:complete len:191 (+) Transcript_6070:486-1058(+)